VRKFEGWVSLLKETFLYDTAQEIKIMKRDKNN